MKSRNRFISIVLTFFLICSTWGTFGVLAEDVTGGAAVESAETMEADVERNAAVDIAAEAVQAASDEEAAA